MYAYNHIFVQRTGYWTIYIFAGGTPSSSTGPTAAYKGTSYLYLESSGLSTGNTAYIKINPLTHTNKILSLRYHGRGSR